MNKEKSQWFRVNSIQPPNKPEEDEFMERSPAEYDAIFVDQVPSSYEQIKDQGRKAYQSGKGISDNPYVAEETGGKEYPKSDAWMDGYKEAKEEAGK